MTTGIQRTAGPGCRRPAPPGTGICHEHRQQARLAQPQHAPPGWVRATARARTRLHQAGHRAEPG
jgi:hypothetical protein